MELIIENKNIRGMQASKKPVDNISVFPKGHFLEENEKWRDQNGRYKYLFQSDEIIENPLFDDKDEKIEIMIRNKLPEILRVIALDDVKQFRDLKIEIKKIIDSIE